MSQLSYESLLTKLEELEARSESVQKKKEGLPKWAKLLLGMLSVLALASGAIALRWHLNKKNKELAKLRTRAEIRQLDLDEERYRARTAELEGVRRNSALRAAEAAMELEQLHNLITEREATHQRMLERIHEAASWDALVAMDREIGR